LSWNSASTGSPRRRRAFPPSAATTLIAHPLEQAFEKGVEHGLRSRQPVGGLQEHRPARTVDDVGEEGDQPLGTSTEGI
jgi:hypothetical protein